VRGNSAGFIHSVRGLLSVLRSGYSGIGFGVSHRQPAPDGVGEEEIMEPAGAGN
jgi:hypothetical protein